MIGHKIYSYQKRTFLRLRKVLKTIF